ncbi:MAG: AMP-binding protein [Candidatus Riflebacteria bacterium]|nr:AMP-binding protein [Candidatus Riflebacteria bacterium]
MTQNGVNMASFIRKNAALTPYKKAVVVPGLKPLKNGSATYASYTFKQLEQATDNLARGLCSLGIKRGSRVIVMIKPSLEFYTVFFTLCKIGATMVMIDTGMGLKNMKTCIEEVAPDAYIGIPISHIPRILFRWGSKTIKTNVCVGSKFFFGGHAYKDLMKSDDSPFPIAEMGVDEPACIMFTSGSTGVAKGAIYTHGMLTTQTEYIKELYDLGSKDSDLATFPLFGLFDVCIGMTSVVPEMNAAKPGKSNPVKLIQAMEDNGTTCMFGSPAVVDIVSRYCEANNVKLPFLERVISCGAPARNDILERFQKALNEGVEIYTPYGATEALPVSSIGSKMILGETAAETDAGGGTCVGLPTGDIQVKIIKITDEPIKNFTPDLELPEGEIGEITVKGSVVSPGYFKRPEQDTLAKIKDGDGFWHRMGDVGKLDSQGRIWFCGRKNQRVVAKDKVYFTIPCERIYNKHPKVFRTALVGMGKRGEQTPVIFCELEKNAQDINPEALIKELMELGSKHEHTKDIKHFLLHPSFPVDIRHNAKINREKLAELAPEALKGRI